MKKSMTKLTAAALITLLFSCAPKNLRVDGQKAQSSTSGSNSAEWILPDNPFQIDQGIGDGVSGADRDETELTAPAGNQEIVAKPGVMTASVVTANRVLMSLVSCTGIGRPSARSLATWQEKYGSFSVEGRANSITAPMLMAQTTLAADVCLDTIEAERTIAERRIFPGIDFNAPASASDLDQVVRRLARSCWGRNETENEKSMIVNETMAAFANAGSAEDSLLFLCTAMLSTVSAMQM